MNAVKRPGSLYFSAIVVVLAQTLLANFGSVAAGGSFLFDCAATSSITRLLRLHRTAVEHVAPPLERRVGHHLGIAALDLGDHAHHVGVIRDGDPVERLSELHRLAAGRGDFLAPRKPRRLLGTERRAAAAGINRPRGVDVLVTEVRALGIAPAGVRRVAGLLVELGRDRPAGSRRCRRSDVPGAGRRTAKLHGRRTAPRQAWPGGTVALRTRRRATLSQSRLVASWAWHLPHVFRRRNRIVHDRSSLKEYGPQATIPAPPRLVRVAAPYNPLWLTTRFERRRSTISKR